MVRLMSGIYRRSNKYLPSIGDSKYIVPPKPAERLTVVAYPSDFPLTEITNVVAIVKNGEIQTKTSEFAMDLWWVQGFAQSQLVGNPNLTQISKAAAGDPIHELEKLVALHQSGTLTAQSAIPWQTILLWAIQELMTLLSQKP